VAQVEPVAQVEAEPLDEREQSLVAWAQQARTKVRNLLDRGSGTDAPEYRVLAEHLLAGTDATEVVAALLRAVAPVPSSPGSSEEPGERGWARLFVSVGRTARVHKEQVEELLREKAGLSAEQIGRIDVLSRYTFLEVCGDVAEQVIERLSGEVLRGREITVARAKPPRNG